MKYKCLIVDDEPLAHKVITSHILQTENLEIAGSVFNGQEALSFLQTNKVDILFLDIEMPKLSGLELLECLPYKTAVILTTAYPNFGFEAYEKDVIDYLLKPISYPRFLKAINKIISVLSPVEIEATYPEIEVKLDGMIKKIQTQDLIYAQSIGNYIKLFLKNEKPMVVQLTMKYMESVLPNTFFIRIHKSFIINKSSIISLSKTEVHLNAKVTLPIGRKYSILLEE